MLITIDTCRADRLGCYGYFRDSTPSIDELAGRSIVFEDAVTHMGTTLPSHLSLMTSARTTRHGLRSNHHVFHPGELRTFAHMLSSAGYRTAAFVSAAPLKAVSGISAGFDDYDEPAERELPADQTTDRARAWLDMSPAEPFFLWIQRNPRTRSCRRSTFAS